MYNLRKRALGCGIELNLIFKELNRLRNWEKGVVASGPESTQLNFNWWKEIEKFRAGCGGTHL